MIYLPEPPTELLDIPGINDVYPHLMSHPAMMLFVKEKYEGILNRTLQVYNAIYERLEVAIEPSWVPTLTKTQWEHDRAFWSFVSDIGLPPENFLRKTEGKYSSEGKDKIIKSHPSCHSFWTVDRINGQRGYIPGNVRWATTKTQIINRPTTAFLLIEGALMRQQDVLEAVGLERHRLFKPANAFVQRYPEFQSVAWELALYCNLHHVKIEDTLDKGIAYLEQDLISGKYNLRLRPDIQFQNTKAIKGKGIPSGRSTSYMDIEEYTYLDGEVRRAYQATPYGRRPRAA